MASPIIIGRRSGLAVHVVSPVARLRARWMTDMLASPSGSFGSGRNVPIISRPLMRRLTT